MNKKMQILYHRFMIEATMLIISISLKILSHTNLGMASPFEDREDYFSNMAGDLLEYLQEMDNE